MMSGLPASDFRIRIALKHDPELQVSSGIRLPSAIGQIQRNIYCVPLYSDRFWIRGNDSLEGDPMFREFWALSSGHVPHFAK
jgi:hypothetical protein